MPLEAFSLVESALSLSTIFVGFFKAFCGLAVVYLGAEVVLFTAFTVLLALGIFFFVALLRLVLLVI